MLSAKSLGALVETELAEAVTDAIEAFSCKDKDVEFFLKNKALEFEKRDKSRTYIICEEETFLSGDVSILAYFTLSLKSLEFRGTLSKNKIKEIDGFSKEVESVAIALIGQFGKDEAKAKEISGKDLLIICMNMIYQVHTLIGGRYVLIECRDIDKVVGFYRGSGFKALQTDKNDDYLQMVRRL
ncbi:MAG: hypothetical protein LBK23_05950 [Oscillospiraceae bacterium]|jgi:hypothetical protein|nr:hypothetical protein [Oscillospiraceae bacterium]